MDAAGTAPPQFVPSAKLRRIVLRGFAALSTEAICAFVLATGQALTTLPAMVAYGICNSVLGRLGLPGGRVSIPTIRYEARAFMENAAHSLDALLRAAGVAPWIAVWFVIFFAVACVARLVGTCAGLIVSRRAFEVRSSFLVLKAICCCEPRGQVRVYAGALILATILYSVSDFERLSGRYFQLVPRPDWLLLAFLALILTSFSHTRLALARLAPPIFTCRCGYAVGRLPVCPECGHTQATAQPAAPPATQHNTQPNIQCDPRAAPTPSKTA